MPPREEGEAGGRVLDEVGFGGELALEFGGEFRIALELFARDVMPAFGQEPRWTS